MMMTVDQQYYFPPLEGDPAYVEKEQSTAPIFEVD
jgi:hypothetical protein